MKRIFAAIIAVLLLFGFAYAEIDISGLSYEELVELNQKIQFALFEKGTMVDGVTVYQGIFIVGEDIPAGNYRVVRDSPVALVEVYTKPDYLFSDKSFTIGNSIPQIDKLPLKDGMKVEITGSVIFYAYTGLFGK